jgi:hypothetical protein
VGSLLVLPHRSLPTRGQLWLEGPVIRSIHPKTSFFIGYQSKLKERPIRILFSLRFTGTAERPDSLFIIHPPPNLPDKK